MTVGALSILLTDAPVSGIGSEFDACAGIDIQAPCGAPGEEIVRIDYGAVRNSASGARLALFLLSATLPSVERRRKDVSIRHDFKNALIIGTSIPRDSGSYERRASCHGRKHAEATRQGQVQ